MKKGLKILHLLLILLLAFIIVLTYIFFHTENLRIGYEIERLRKERERLKEEIESLEIENAKLRNLQRIKKIARELGMREIIKENIVILKFLEEKNLNEPYKEGEIKKDQLNLSLKMEERK